MTKTERNIRMDRLLAEMLELATGDHPIREVVERYNRLYNEDYIAYDNNEHAEMQRVPDDLEVKTTSYNTYRKHHWKK